MTRILLAVVIVIMFPMSVVAQNCPLPDKASIGDGRQCICDKGILLCLDYEPKDDNHKMGKAGEEMTRLTFNDCDTRVKIYFRIPFFQYFLGRYQTGDCKHEMSELVLFRKFFVNDGLGCYQWELI